MGKATAEQAAARAEITERIEEAADVLRRMPDRERSLLNAAERGFKWPLIVHSADEHAAFAREPARRPPPSSRQITRMEEVLDWLLVLGRHNRDYLKAVWVLCAMRKPIKMASNILGCHRETATIWRDAGLDRIVQHRAVPTADAIKLKDTLMQGMHHPQRRAG